MSITEAAHLQYALTMTTTRLRWISFSLLLSLCLIFAVCCPCSSFAPLSQQQVRQQRQQRHIIQLYTNNRAKRRREQQQRDLSSSLSSSSSSSPAVLCIGDVLLDCIANNEARGWSVDKLLEQEQQEGKKWTTAYAGGAPANVATACMKLGTPSAICACLGNDEEGHSLECVLKEGVGVNTALLQFTDMFPTRQVLVTRSVDGERQFGGFVPYGRTANEFADCSLDASEVLSKVANDDESILTSVQWIVCSTLSLAYEKSREAVIQLIDRALEQQSQQHGAAVRLLVDVNWRPVFWQDGSHTGKEEEDEARQTILSLVQKAHVVKMTNEEAEWLLGIPSSDAFDDPARVQKEFLPNASVGVLITAGDRGASYSILGCTGNVHAYRVPVIDTTGAGDAFTAGFIHGFHTIIDSDNGNEEEFESMSLEERCQVIQDIVRFASAVGALTCTKEGAIAAQPTYDQVESFLIHGEKVWS